MGKDYTKPVVSRVELVPAEATLCVCKTLEGVFNMCAFENTCHMFGGPNECFDVGS